MNYPMIEIDGKTYYQIACSKCETANEYKIYTDGKGTFYTECHNCGRRTNLARVELKRHPDPKPIPLHQII